MMIKKIVMVLCILMGLQVIQRTWAEEIPMYPVSIDLGDKEKLQRGARMFMNYCSGCHSLKYLRYNRMAEALGLMTFDGQLDEDLLKNNLIFTSASIYDPIRIAMPAEDAKQWFGVVPPDLSLSARARGPDWIYNYLKSFYSDKSRPFGANNLLIPGVAMPNVLEPLIGKVVLTQDNQTHESSLALLEPGQMYPAEFDSALQDLVTFLVYVGEPAKLVRYKIGFFVLAFLGIFYLVARNLKKVYWARLKKKN